MQKLLITTATIVALATPALATEPPKPPHKPGHIENHIGIGVHPKFDFGDTIATATTGPATATSDATGGRGGKGGSADVQIDNSGDTVIRPKQRQQNLQVSRQEQRQRNNQDVIVHGDTVEYEAAADAVAIVGTDCGVSVGGSTVGATAGLSFPAASCEYRRDVAMLQHLGLHDEARQMMLAKPRVARALGRAQQAQRAEITDQTYNGGKYVTTAAGKNDPQLAAMMRRMEEERDD